MASSLQLFELMYRKHLQLALALNHIVALVKLAALASGIATVTYCTG